MYDILEIATGAFMTSDRPQKNADKITFAIDLPLIYQCSCVAGASSENTAVSVVNRTYSILEMANGWSISW